MDGLKAKLVSALADGFKPQEHKKTEHSIKCSKCRQFFEFKDKLENHVEETRFSHVTSAYVVLEVHY